MQIGERLRELREAKNFSQGEIEKRTGLLRCSTSRVENGHTIPVIEMLEKYARALTRPIHPGAGIISEYEARCVAYMAHLLTSFGMWLGFVSIPVSLEPGLHPPAKRQVITLT